MVHPDPQHQTLPTGTVTFLFTDVEGSTRLLQGLGEQAFSVVLDRHHQIIREAVMSCGGVVVGTEGDSFFAAFDDASSGVTSAAQLQRSLQSEPWPEGCDLRVRVGLHTGTPILGGDNYVGVDVHRAARIGAAAHGGQVVLSAATADAIANRLPSGVGLRRLGKFKLADFPQPEALYQLEIEGCRSEFPPLRGAETLSRLPQHLTDFVGREDELNQARALLGTTRLLTLTGPGGSGKTRLAIELARSVDPEFLDGVFFVSLALIKDPALIHTTILEEMGLVTASGVDPFDRLMGHLAERQMLLLLDNFEQVQDGAGVVSEMIDRAPDLKLVVTSRAPLRLTGERELPVPPLQTPPSTGLASTAGEYAAVKLFASRAASVRPDFRLSDENATTVAAITSRLDGLPLAIELAASRIRTLTPQAILDRLGNKLLATTSHDVPTRQQTIVETISWSYDLLDADAKRLFEQCSVFAGSFGLSEAEAVVSSDDLGIDVVDGLETLIENSLVERADALAEPRFRMLSVIREYGYGALVARGDDGRVLRRHAEVFADLAEKAGVEILTSKQKEWLDRLSVDHDDLRAAIDWAVLNKETTLALRLVGSLWRFFQMRGHVAEGRQRIEAALALEGGDLRARAVALTGLGGIRYWQGEWDATIEPYGKALELMRECGDEADIAYALYNLSFPVGYGGDYATARALQEESLEISKRLGDSAGVGRAYWALGDVAVYQEDWDTTLDYMLRAAEELRKGDAPFDLGWSYFMLAFAMLRLERNDESQEHSLKALEIFAEVGDLSAMTLILESLGLLAIRNGQPLKAARLLGGGHRIKAETGVNIGDITINQYQEVIEFLEHLDDLTHAAYEEGMNLGLEELLAIARDV